jgi:hypothetical protein
MDKPPIDLPEPTIAGTAHANEFKNFGFISVKLTDEQLLPIRAEANKLQKDFNKGMKFNDVLAGNIKNEYKLVDSHKHINDLVLPYVLTYEKHYQYMKSQHVLSSFADAEIVLENSWVNFQKKHEFNPPHTHGGLMSFVIWLSIPYTMAEEMKVSPGSKSRDPLAGHFAFQYINSVGQITPHAIPADKSMEGMLVIFPATMTHSVYPFYSSDKFRITVSGNYTIKMPNNNLEKIND